MATYNRLKEALANGDRIVWVITKDHIDDGDAEGESNVPQEVYDEVKHLMTHKFKIYDDDGELYYEGLATNQSDENAFEPLDWAMANAGATEIKYLNNGRWETL